MSAGTREGVAAGSRPALPEPNPHLRAITLEEHFATPALLDGPARHVRRLAATQPEFAGVAERLLDFDERIAAMDEAGIDVQVLSLTAPGVEQLDAAEACAVAREANDSLADATARHAGRLLGFAAVPTPAPEAAADELERAVRRYGFRGALINGHVRGRYLDDEFFWPILERAQALDVPIYLHPTLPPQTVREAYYAGNFPPAAAEMFAQAAWGWHIETAVHLLRLVLAGAFDRFPRLQLLVGHMGEALPFMLARLDQRLPVALTGLERPLSAYLRENVGYTMSGFNQLAAFLPLQMHVGVERIFFSADYPYSSMRDARAFLDRLPVTPADRERIAHGNAERLLRLPGALG